MCVSYSNNTGVTRFWSQSVPSLPSFSRLSCSPWFSCLHLAWKVPRSLPVYSSVQVLAKAGVPPTAGTRCVAGPDPFFHLLPPCLLWGSLFWTPGSPHCSWSWWESLPCPARSLSLCSGCVPQSARPRACLPPRAHLYPRVCPSPVLEILDPDRVLIGFRDPLCSWVPGTQPLDLHVSFFFTVSCHLLVFLIKLKVPWGRESVSSLCPTMP